MFSVLYFLFRKKRMHLNASLPQHLQKEWLALYPDSSLTGKRLLEIFETHSISSVINDSIKQYMSISLFINLCPHTFSNSVGS